jgi:hypothetical protein
MVRGNLLRDGSGRGATLAYRITVHYELLAQWQSRRISNARLATAVWVA